MHEKSAQLLLLAAWFALITSLGEISIRGVQKFFLHQFVFVSPYIVWMAPLANLLLFAIAGLALCLVARYCPRLVSLRLAASSFAFLTFSGPLLWYSRLHVYAALLLAVGLAVQAARSIAAHSQGFHTLVRYTVGWMAVAIVGLTVSVYGWRVLTEREALATLPPASRDAPNVLLIVLDTVRARNLSLYGYPRPTTPQLERMANTGVVFERALSTSPWTLPSHATLFTGRFPHELSADWLTPLNTIYPTLAEVFSAHGYVTAGFVANLLYCTYETVLQRGFVHYEDYPISPGMIAHSSWLARTITERLRRAMGNHQTLVRKTAAEVNKNFLRWLSQKGERPFFAFLNYMDAHEPYLPPKPFDLKFARKQLRDPWVREGYQYAPEEIQALMDAYDGAIAYIDHQLGLLFDELGNRSLLENTLVIITSDHGEQFGEHALMSHGNSLYLPLLHVPLVISFPSRVPAGTRVHEPVTLRNIPATVVDLIKFKGKPFFPGDSFLQHWSGGRFPGRATTPLLSEVHKSMNQVEWFPVMKGDMQSLVMDGRHYIKNGDGREELYDFENDPAEERDLADSEEGRRALERFRRSLTTLLARNRTSN
jgi:arylsulfatase A-like enzyme